jgi:hypothetical protein
LQVSRFLAAASSSFEALPLSQLGLGLVLELFSLPQLMLDAPEMARVVGKARAKLLELYGDLEKVSFLCIALHARVLCRGSGFKVGEARAKLLELYGDLEKVGRVASHCKAGGAVVEVLRNVWAAHSRVSDTAFVCSLSQVWSSEVLREQFLALPLPAVRCLPASIHHFHVLQHRLYVPTVAGVVLRGAA